MPDIIPTISVVIPLFNKEKYVGRAIDSVLSQTFQDFEVVVVNDGSTDNSPEIVRGCNDHRIRLVDQENKGVASARNRGVTESKSDLIAFLDADDEWLPNFLETILGLVERFPDAGLYATGYRLLKSDKHAYRNITIKGGCEKCGCYFDLSRKKYFISASSVAIRRSVFDRVGGFRVGYVSGDDMDMWFRIGLWYKFALSPTICTLYHYYISDNAHRTKLLSAVSPLYASFSEMKEDAQISPSVKCKAMKYLTHKLAKKIEITFLNGLHITGTQRLHEYREAFGVTSSYLGLLCLSMIPRAVLHLGGMIRLKSVKFILTLRSVTLNHYRSICLRERKS